MKIAVVSLGCNKNLVDTEVMLAHLIQAGCEVIDDPEEADCLFVNTCSFLQEAVEESLDCIVGLAQLKGKEGPGRLVVAGCLVSRYGDEILKEIPEVDALVPPDDLERVVRAVKSTSAVAKASGGKMTDRGRSTEGRVAKHPTSNFKLTGNVQRLTSNVQRDLPATSNLKPQTSNVESNASNPQSSILNSQSLFPPRILSYPPHRAYLKIGEGCSNKCSYCLIPILRGESISRTPESLLAEMDHLVRNGVKEVTLVAQDSGRYGMDHVGVSLPSLIELLLSVPGDYWLRVLYIHPSRITDELLEVLASDPRVCRYLDVPFQHVSPSILREMGRGDSPHPEEVVRNIRRVFPDVFLRTTFMTGFPGETEHDFEMLRDFVAQGHIDHLGVFVYSREEGTPAAQMTCQVDPQTARDRADALLLEQAEISAESLTRFAGKKMRVLFEGRDEEGPFGRHQGQAPEVDGVVRLDRELEQGSFVTVRITGTDVYDLEGEVL